MKLNNSNTIFDYLLKYLRQLSTKGVYALLLLFYAYKDGNVPSWAKKIIIGAIAYFLSPIDSIPDLTPFIGMTDDMGIISFGLVTISCYINEEVRDKAFYKLNALFKSEIDKSAVAEVNDWL